MTEYKVPIYYGAGDRLQLFTYTSMSLVNDIIYTVINNILYKGLITNAKLKDIDNILSSDYILYFKQALFFYCYYNSIANILRVRLNI